MISAQRADGPRWGDFYEKLDLTFLSYLIKNGIWFDGSRILKKVSEEDDKDFAPNYLLSHRKEFYSLLQFNDTLKP